jgi:pyrimidine operon attenuation protein/uracil phosphoribosyltransferase
MGKTLCEIFGEEERVAKERREQTEKLLREEIKELKIVLAAIVLRDGGETKVLHRDLLALGGPDGFQICTMNDVHNRALCIKVELLGKGKK